MGVTSGGAGGSCPPRRVSTRRPGPRLDQATRAAAEGGEGTVEPGCLSRGRSGLRDSLTHRAPIYSLAAAPVTHDFRETLESERLNPLTRHDLPLKQLITRTLHAAAYASDG